jgi:hypothetical protein
VTSRVRAWVLGSVVVGTLDLADAFIYFGFQGVAPVRILKGIAGGWLGRAAAMQGGPGVAALGLVSHYLIATLIVGTCLLVSRVVPLLAQRPWLAGPVYGIGAWLVMNFLVVPLSALGPPHLTMPVVINGLLIHMFGIGLPSALSARAALGRTRS